MKLSPEVITIAPRELCLEEQHMLNIHVKYDTTVPNIYDRMTNCIECFECFDYIDYTKHK